MRTLKAKKVKPTSARTTATAVNDALRARGRDESLRRADGYFYFGGGEAVNWFTTSVRVQRLSDLTVDQWLKEFDALLERDKKFRKGVTVKPKRKS
jgi:hypothetical protein